LEPVHLQQLRTLRGVLTDIDDTLTADGRIEPVARQALQALADAGMPVIAVTGRPAGWSEPCALHWPLAAVVAENGAVLLRREGDGLQRLFIDDEATRHAHRQRLRHCAQVVLLAVPGATLARDSAGRLTDIAIDHSEFAHLDAEAIAAVVALMQQHGLTATVSSIHINGWLGDHDKWTGAQWAVQHCLGRPLRPDDWLYVGDSTNDQVMFEHLPLSVGVANIADFAPQMRTLPAYVTQGERGVGFAEVVRAMLGARRAR
jgi:HAD superfamily hydrolase (TIGR01484 family)